MYRKLPSENDGVAACSTSLNPDKELCHDPATPADARRHGCPKPRREYPIGIRETRRRLRETLSQLAGRTRSGRVSRLSGLFDAVPDALAEQSQRRDRRTALPLQGDAQTRLGSGTDSDAQEALQAAGD